MEWKEEEEEKRERERGIIVADDIISKTKERNNFANSNSSD